MIQAGRSARSFTSTLSISFSRSGPGSPPRLRRTELSTRAILPSWAFQRFSVMLPPARPGLRPHRWPSWPGLRPHNMPPRSGLWSPQAPSWPGLRPHRRPSWPGLWFVAQSCSLPLGLGYGRMVDLLGLVYGIVAGLPGPGFGLAVGPLGLVYGLLKHRSEEHTSELQ